MDVSQVAAVRLSVDLLPGTAELLARHTAAMPQKDELCGPFSVSVALHAVLGQDAAPDQDAIARAAGTVISRDGHRDVLPFGQGGRGDYRLELPVTDDADAAGTAAAGLVAAVEALVGVYAVAVPVSGPWDADGVVGLLRALAASDEPVGVAVNVATRHLWGSRPRPADVLAQLDGRHAQVAPDWDVGHFCLALGLVSGQGGELVLVADTYPVLGWHGVHVQPPDALAAALRRSGLPTDGGVLVIAPRSAQDSIGAVLDGLGLERSAWDNGSPVHG